MNKFTERPAVFLLAVMALLVSCGTNTKKDSEEKVRKERVQTQVLQQREIARNLDFTSVLEGYETMNVAPSLTGIIEHIYVEVGSRVKQGDMLVRMDQNQYKTTKLTYANLTIEMQRMEALMESGSISQQTYDQTKLSFDQTKESLDFLEVNTYVKAPFQGVISAKNYEDGELYSGQAILTLTQINLLKSLINIPETYFPLVKEGMKIELRSLRIPNSSELLRPGMYTYTTLALGKEQTIVVPYQAVLKLQGANDRYVFLNDNGVAKRVAVTLGQRFDDQVEIISDEIKEGDELVVVGQARLVDGVKLEIVNTETANAAE